MLLSEDKLNNIRQFHSEIFSPNVEGYAKNLPLLLSIESTSRCNFKCVHCSKTFDESKHADLDLSLFQRISELVSSSYEVYLFGDGEVLLDIPRHLAMMSRIHQLDPSCELGFSTNGKLLTPNVYELYATAGIKYIQVSVDAASRDLYQKMRKGGLYDELCDNLEGIAALRKSATTIQPQLNLATVISKQNYHQLPQLAEFARRYSFSRWYVNVEYPHNPGRDKFRLTAEDLSQLEIMKARLIKEYSSDLYIHFDPAIGLSPAGTSFKWLTQKSPVYCTVPWQRLEMKANGDIKVCPYFHEPICNIQNREIDDVWNGTEFRSLRKSFHTGKDIPSFCVDCKCGWRKQYLPGYPGMPDFSEIIFDNFIRKYFHPMLKGTLKIYRYFYR